jgi:hypothetical protein
METPVPIQTVHLFPALDAKLLDLLRSLNEEEWHYPTIAKKWLVRDIAAHLLDGNLRTLSFSRDKYLLKPSEPNKGYQELVEYLNELNAVWVKAARRLSPGIILQLLELTGPAYCDHMKKLDPFDNAIFSVAWAGEEVSSNWFHIAREYTEKFIHQQQIRDAVQKPGIMTRDFFYPFIETFLQALPYTYRFVKSDPGVTVQVKITTESGGDWYLTRLDDGWNLGKEKKGNIKSIVSIDPDTAWKLFSKGITAAEAGSKLSISGNQELGEPVLQMVSVMA